MTDKIKDVEIRVATADDARLFYPDGCPRSCYGWIASYKGEPACFAGLIIERGGCVAFSEIKPGITAPRMTIWRTALVLLEHIKALNLPMYAGCDLQDKMAHKFVQMLGFIRQREFQEMELFLWQA